MRKIITLFQELEKIVTCKAGRTTPTMAIKYLHDTALCQAKHAISWRVPDARQQLLAGEQTQSHGHLTNY